MDVFGDALRHAFLLLTRADAGVLDIVRLSVQVSGTALLIAVTIGMPAGIALAISRFPGRRVVVALVYTGFALPPVVVGLLVHMLLSRSGPLAALQLLYTPGAMILAQVVLAAPYVTGITLAAVQAVPDEVRLQARALGARPVRAVWMQVREARLGLAAAVVAGFGAVISEVGAVMLVGGNVLGETRVMTTAILLETRRGAYGAALALGLILLTFAFSINIVLTRLQQGSSRDRRAGRRP